MRSLTVAVSTLLFQRTNFDGLRSGITTEQGNLVARKHVPCNATVLEVRLGCPAQPTPLRLKELNTRSGPALLGVVKVQLLRRVVPESRGILHEDNGAKGIRARCATAKKKEWVMRWRQTTLDLYSHKVTLPAKTSYGGFFRGFFCVFIVPLNCFLILIDVQTNQRMPAKTNSSIKNVNKRIKFNQSINRLNA